MIQYCILAGKLFVEEILNSTNLNQRLIEKALYSILPKMPQQSLDRNVDGKDFTATSKLQYPRKLILNNLLITWFQTERKSEGKEALKTEFQFDIKK